MAGIYVELPDAAARCRALMEHDRTLLVEAGAGSGKTGLLAGRVAMLLCEGVEPREIVAITFTVAAASELRGRIHEYIQKLLNDDVPPVFKQVLSTGSLNTHQKEQLEKAFRELDQLTCTTIDGFCSQILRPYPVEANIDPGASVIDPGEAEIVYEELLSDWLNKRYGRHRGVLDPEANFDNDLLAELVKVEPEPGKAIELVREAAILLRQRYTAKAPKVSLRPEKLEKLRTVITDFCQWYDGCGLIEENTASILADLQKLSELLVTTLDDTSICMVLRLLCHPKPNCRHGKEMRFKRWGNKGRWEKAAMKFGRTKAEGARCSDEGCNHYKKCSEAYEPLISHLTDVVLCELIDEVQELLQRYQKHKRDRALLDFGDLLHHTRKLLKNHDSIRNALAQRYPRILVDEFQDTDLLQCEIFWRLCGEGHKDLPWEEHVLRPGSLFLVGDSKQAIYRFRGADIDAYLKAKAAIERQNSQAIIEITVNFRSQPSIIDFINSRFRGILDRSEGQPGYAALSAHRQSVGHGTPVSVFEVQINERQRDTRGKLVIDEVRRLEAEIVAETIKRLIGSYEVWERHEDGWKPRTCKAGDIALLAPTGTNLWIYEEIFEKAGIAITTQAGKGFFRRQEVKDLIAVVRTLADPKDTVALGALLRGPLVGLTEEKLADTIEALGEGGRLTLWTSPAECVDPVLHQTLETLQSLARKAHSTTPYQLMAEAIEALHARSLLSARHQRNSERALANVELFLEMTQPYAMRGLSDFARAMWRKWEEAEREVEGRADAINNSVSIITIHSAKGLEWPIVIPINSMTSQQERFSYLYRREDDTIHFKLWEYAGSEYVTVKDEEASQQRREQIRLWYVALTRACDLLLLPRQSERNPNDWMALVDLALENLPALTFGDAKEVHVPTEIENIQDLETWTRQVQTIAAHHRLIEWHQPSRHEDSDGQVQTLDEPTVVQVNTAVSSEEKIQISDDALPIQGSRERGLILHKLIEEILNAETEEDPIALKIRARELIAELGQQEAQTPADGLQATELAQAVLRGLTLPEIVALRPRLIPEMTVYGCNNEGTKTLMISGIADAIALDANGQPDTVIDWKSDVLPTESQLNLYREQVRDYLKVSNASQGLIVFLTSGRIVPVWLG